MRTSKGLALVVVGFALVFAAGCDKKKGKAKPPPATADAAVAKAPTPDAAVRTPPPTPTVAAEAGINNMKHCPSAVDGAKTTIKKEKDVVVVAITGEGDEMLSAIRGRAKHLTDVQAAPDDKVEHTGKGTGGSAAGACPVITKDTTIAVAETKDGVTVTMTPKAPMTVDALEADAQKRLAEMTAKLAEPKTGGDDGTGKGKGTGGGGGQGTGGGDNSM
jgi:hypothetical protein